MYVKERDEKWPMVGIQNKNSKQRLTFFLAKVANQKTLNLLARRDRVPFGRPSREDHEAVCAEHAHHSTTHLVFVG